MQDRGIVDRARAREALGCHCLLFDHVEGSLGLSRLDDLRRLDRGLPLGERGLEPSDLRLLVGLDGLRRGRHLERITACAGSVRVTSARCCARRIGRPVCKRPGPSATPLVSARRPRQYLSPAPPCGDALGQELRPCIIWAQKARVSVKLQRATKTKDNKRHKNV